MHSQKKNLFIIIIIIEKDFGNKCQWSFYSPCVLLELSIIYNLKSIGNEIGWYRYYIKKKPISILKIHK